MNYRLHTGKSSMPFAVGVLTDAGRITKVVGNTLTTNLGHFSKDKYKPITRYFLKDGKRIYLSGSLAEDYLHTDEIDEDAFKTTSIFGQEFAIDKNFTGYVTSY